MRLFCKLAGRWTGILIAAVMCAGLGLAQQAGGTLRGKIVDEFGGVIVGATVTVTDASGTTKTTTTNNDGLFTFSSLAPGSYTVHATAPGFAPFEQTGVEVSAARREPLNITLSVTLEKQEVTVSAEAPVSVEPENNAGAIVLRGADLESLPDDPDDLAEALQALAGPAAGPNGGQIFIDGFTGGRLPPKDSIREIRINQNPFSAEYDHIGFGRIEILTKPGSDRLRGQGFFSFSDESLNSRNPFAANRAPYQMRNFGGNIGGPIVKKKASFFVDLERRELDDNSVINATILDPSLNIVAFNRAVLTPQRRFSFSPRVDYQLNPKNTLVMRYSYERSRSIDNGIGNFSLPERAYDSVSTEHSFQVTETAIINPRIVNETRFRILRSRDEEDGDNSRPTINVLDSFTGGGSTVGLSSNTQDRWELQNYTTFSLGRHSMKAGMQLRHESIDDISRNNFGGTYTFAGGPAPELDANNQIIPGTSIEISSIERYRRTLLFKQLGYSPEQIRALGGGARQFSIAGGNPEADVTQTELGVFLQDDWRLRPDFTLSLGLRYENQTNINSNLNFAPRIAFAWAPGAGGTHQSKTVIRGGFGIFYDRFSENLTLQALRFNGVNQQQYVVFDPAILNLFPAVPSVETLTAFAVPQTIRRIATDLQAPYSVQSTFSVERQLSRNTTLFANYINTRMLHMLRSRNINAPIPGTVIPGVANSGVRPFGDVGNIYQYESSGILKQNQLIVGLRGRLSQRISLFANYTLGKADSNTDGAGTFPANQYDLSDEFGRAAFDIRHRFTVFGSINLPWNVTVNPFIIATSGRPFNITTGRDNNGDSLFTDRPAFATDLTKPGVVVTPFGAFDPNPTAGETIIPRNYAEGPGFFSLNLRLSKTWGFGDVPGGNVASGSPQDGRRGGRGMGGGGRGGRGMGGGPFIGGMGGMFGGPSGPEKRYNLTLSFQIQNLLNSVNPSTPVGNMTSPLFLQSTSTAGSYGVRFGGGGGNPGNLAAGNRSVVAQLRFSF